MMRQWIMAALALPLAAAAARAEDIVILPTRDGASQSYLLSAPAGNKARAVAILFPGGDGKTDLEQETARTAFVRGNFLVRSRRHFTGNGIAAAVVDAPSDRPGGMDDWFRLGAAHAEDIGKVVADVRKRYPGLPVFLVGTSRGTVSAASVGARLGKTVDGVVLTSSVFLANKRYQGLSGFDLSSIASPLLIVHHAEDACDVTPYSSAKRLADRYPLITVAGGLPPKSSSCEGMSAHGFFGKEAETVNAISGWLLKQPYSREIN